MGAQETALFFFAGIKEAEQSKSLALDEGSVNFYPTKNGEYLQNYPGKVSIFKTGDSDPPATNIIAIPPVTSMKYTRVAAFTDYLGIDHVVFVADNKLYTVEGNGARLLYTFTGLGRGGTADIQRWPHIFQHEQKLIILNAGDDPIVWDGVEGAVPLGVREVPDPPSVINCGPVFDAVSGSSPSYAGHNPWDSTSGASEPRRWHVGVQYESKLAQEKDSAGTPNNISGYYSWRVQFVDIFGNKGKASAPNPAHRVPHESEFSVGTWGAVFPTVYWTPPVADSHILGVNVGRSTNQHLDDPTPGSDLVMFIEHAQSNVTQSRFTSNAGDDTLANLSAMDILVGPPPTSQMGCSFGGRIFLVSMNQNRVYFSDSTYFGQFRETSSINPYSNVTALVPAGDRMFVIGEQSTEVYYIKVASDGTEVVSLLEQDIHNGSDWGKSFASVGDGVVFGLWNNGFGFFDGVNHKYVQEPYWVRDIYLDNDSHRHSAIAVGDWYYLTIRRGFKSADNDTILMYNMQTDNWYIIEDSINDLAYWNGEILGVSDHVYCLFRGNTYTQARIRTIGLTPELHTVSNTLSGLRVLMEPSAFKDITISVEGEETFNKSEGSGYAHPLKHRMGRSSHQVPYSYWGDGVTDFSDSPDWLAPGDFWMVPILEKNISAFSHSVDITFTAGFPVKIKALGLTYSKVASISKGS